MNICVVSHSGGLGGAELAILETTLGLRQEGHTISVVCPNDGPFIAKAKEAAQHVAIIPFDHWTAYGSWNAITKLKMARGYWLAARRLAAFFKQEKADLIVTNTSTFPSAAIAAKSSGIPHLWYLHEFVEEDHGLRSQFGQEKSYKLIGKLSASVVVNSMAVHRKANQHISSDKLHLVYCATVTQLKEKARLSPAQPLRMVMAGSVSQGKNQLLALKALHLLKERGVEAHIAIIGHADGGYMQVLEQYCAGHGLEEQVVFRGYTDSLQGEFDTADGFLLTSRNEAFGRVLVEAGRAGLPCIAPDSGGAPEIVTDGQNGLIFASGNAEALADAIAKLANDHSLYTRLAAAASPMANDRFNLQKHLAQFRHAMEGALAPVLK